MPNSSGQLNTSHWVQVDRPWPNQSQSRDLLRGCPASQPASKAMSTTEAWLKSQSTVEGPYHTIGNVRACGPSQEATYSNAHGPESQASGRASHGGSTTDAHAEQKTGGSCPV